MNTHTEKTPKQKSQSVANSVSQKQQHNPAPFQFVDNRPEAVAQRKLKEQTAQYATQQPVVQMAGGNNAFLAGKKDYWHVHYDHVKFDTDDGTRVDFAGRNAKKIRKN
jgi:hypothetical protein